MTSIKDQNEEIVVGMEPTEEDMFYVSWRDSIVKDSVNLVNQVLRQFLTLSMALVAGSIAVFDKPIAPAACKTTAMLFFLIALMSSIFGTLPLPKESIRSPEIIKKCIHDSLRTKKRYLWGAALFILGGLVFLIFGVILATQS